MVFYYLSSLEFKYYYVAPIKYRKSLREDKNRNFDNNSSLS